MALEPIAADLIEKIAAHFKTLPATFERNVLCLGYPDVLSVNDSPVPNAADHDRIAAWHRWHGRVLDADAWFASLDLKPQYWDVVASRGPEQIVDFNEIAVQDGYVRLPARVTMFPDPPSEQTQFALCIDPGTTEHVFCASNVFAAMAQLTMVNGYCLHVNPYNLGNHGMWGINPTAYYDFYECNGFEILNMAELSGPLEKRRIRPVPAAKRFDPLPNSTMLCLAQRKSTNARVSWPRQAKYRANPMLKGAIS